MAYGRSSAALDNISSVLGDMQQRGEMRKSQDMAQSQRDAQIRTQLLAAYMQQPDENKRRILMAQGIQVPDLQMTPQQEAEIAIANRRKQSAGVQLDPTQEQLLSMGVVQGGWAPKDVTDFTVSKNNMDPAVFKTYMNEGSTPANEVAKNKADAFKNTTEGQFNQGPRARQADASAGSAWASAEASRANAKESGTRLGLIKEQATNEALRRDPTSPVSPGFTKPQPGAPKPNEFASEAILAIDDLLKSPGFEAAIGAKNVLVTNPVTGKPYGGTDAAEIEPKYARIRGLMTMPNLGIMKGVLSDSDIRMLQSIGMADVTNMKEGTARQLLMKAREALAGKVGGGRVDARIKVTADEHFGGDVTKATEYLRNHGAIK